MPHLPREVVYWRLYYMVGDVSRIGRRQSWLRYRSHGLCDPTDLETAAAQLLDYARAGLQSAASGEAIGRGRSREAARAS